MQKNLDLYDFIKSTPDFKKYLNGAWLLLSWDHRTHIRADVALYKSNMYKVKRTTVGKLD